MRNFDEMRNMLPVKAEPTDSERIFQQDDIAKLYQTVRSAPTVETHYQNMLEQLKQEYKRVYAVKEILEDGEVLAENESLLRRLLLKVALDKIVAEGKGDIESVVRTIITEENVIKAIDELKKIRETNLDTFCKLIIQGAIFRAGAKFLK